MSSGGLWRLIAVGGLCAGCGSQALSHGPLGHFWNQLDSQHLSVLTDVDADAASDMVRDFERSYEGVRAYLNPRGGDLPEPTRVLLLRRPVDYQYVFGSKSAAEFNRFGSIVEYSNDIVLSWEDQKTARETFQHEITHRFIASRYPGAPAWVNEGLASVLESGRFEEDGFVVGRPPAKYWHDASGILIAGRYPAWTLAEPASIVRAARTSDFVDSPDEHYVGAWTLVHLLDLGLDSDHRAFRAYLDDLQAGRGATTFTRHFSPEELRRIDRHYELFLRSGHHHTRTVRVRSSPREFRARPLGPADAHVRWGWVRWSFRGDAARAMDSANTAIRLDPDCAEAYLLRGALYSERDADREAESDLRSARLLAPDDPKMMRALGIHLLFSSDWWESRLVPSEVDRLADALRPHARTANDTLFLATWELFHGRTERAVDASARALRDDPGCTRCYVVGGIAASAGGDRSEGERWLRTAVAVASERELPMATRMLTDLDEIAERMRPR